MKGQVHTVQALHKYKCKLKEKKNIQPLKMMAKDEVAGGTILSGGKNNKSM